MGDKDANDHRNEKQMNQINQKELSKKYSYLHGKYLDVYLGRTSRSFKHISTKLYIAPGENSYGEYKKINIEITGTHYNGNRLIIIPKPFANMGYLEDFKINDDDIPLLIELIKKK